MPFSAACSAFERICIGRRTAKLTFMRKFFIPPPFQPRPSCCRNFASSSRVLGQARIPDGGFTSKWKGISFRNSSPAWVGKRLFAAPSRKQLQEEKNRNSLKWLIVVVVGALALSYAAVPLYRMFCQATGFGGTTQDARKKSTSSDPRSAELRPNRPVTVRFNADVSVGMRWKFVPCQREVKCVPGERVLVFFNATNLTDDPVIGISSYHVSPSRAGLYFNKIQCFCFDEQLLRAKESVDMPVLFYVDPEFDDDENLLGVDELTLSYTFFRVPDEEVADERLVQFLEDLREQGRIEKEKQAQLVSKEHEKQSKE